jgi:hypothetical protein
MLRDMIPNLGCDLCHIQTEGVWVMQRQLIADVRVTLKVLLRGWAVQEGRWRCMYEPVV